MDRRQVTLVYILDWICAVIHRLDEGNPISVICVEIPLLRWTSRVIVPRDPVEGRVLTKGFRHRDTEDGGHPFREGALNLK